MPDPNPKTTNLTPVEETDRERFVRLAGLRVGNSLDALRKVGLLANKSQYKYDESDVAKIEEALTEAVNTACKALRAGKPTSSTFSL